MGIRGDGRRLARWVACLVGLTVFVGGVAPAGAAAPGEFLTIPVDGAPGEGAGRLDNPRDIATNSETGHVYVSDLRNNRISEFTAWGEFVKAWGWDVAPGAVDEEQEVRVRASGGEFRLAFGGEETGDLAFDAEAEDVEAELEALPAINLGGGGVDVSGGEGEGLRVYVVRFDAGPLAGSNVGPLTASEGTIPLSGGDPASEVTVSVRANGTPGGVGLESCTAISGCQAGTPGDGVGQLTQPKGLTVDANGDVYVFQWVLEGTSVRLQKFSPAGEFIWMIGGGVNQGGGAPANPGNLCTAQHLANGDVCGAGATGTEPRQFSEALTSIPRNLVVYSSAADAVLVGDKDRIQKINPDGSFGGQISFDAPGPLEGLDEKTVGAITADSTGDIYLALVATDGIFKLDAAGAPLGAPYPLDVAAPFAMDVDGENNVYVIPSQTALGGKEVAGFDQDGTCISGMCLGSGFGALANPAVNLLGLGANRCAGSELPGNLYVSAFLFNATSQVKVYGSLPFGCGPPPLAPPSIEDQFASAVDIDGATVNAAINPRLWNDTTYYVQYGTGECSEGGCPQSAPVPPGRALSTAVTNVPLPASAFLDDLAPNTTYHYRFVAQSSGGGPVFGVDPDGEGAGEATAAEGLEGTFTTFRAPTPPPDCANDGFRGGLSSKLPDCRAYEMISPLEKGNADILTPAILALDRTSLDGARFTYSSATTFGEDPAGAAAVAQYLAERRVEDRVIGEGETGDGWHSESISPRRTLSLPLGLSPKFKNEFKGFLPDLCTGWLRFVFNPPLTDDAPRDTVNLYKRDNCDPGKGSYEAITKVPAPAQIAEFGGLELQGYAADGSGEVLAGQYDLNELSIPEKCHAGTQACAYRLYQRLDSGELSFVCVLPIGNPIDAETEACYAGTARIESFGDGMMGSFKNVVSADGSRVFWTAGKVTSTETGLGGGRIYMRVDNAETLDVSKTGEELSGTTKSVYHSAADDGSRAIFTTGSDLYSFDAEAALSAEPDTNLIADDVVGVLGASENARRVYFASRAVLPGSGENSEEDEAVVGEPNLYLWTEGAGFEFIGTLTDGEDTGDSSALGVRPMNKLSRVAADGRHAVFNSTASLTGYDNTDAVEGVPASEVFLYDAASGQLRCVSCNPTGARPTGRELKDADNFPTFVWAAAQLPAWGRSIFPSRPLSEDGRRVFFESQESLVPRDNNSLQDVYQWEELGAGGCTAGDSTFSPEAGGCVDLISSGESSRAAEFTDASPSGNDVFFSTLSSLIPPDYGLIDIYDARVGGGFLYPEREPPCEGEACQSPPPPPPVSTPASGAYSGPGNVQAKKKAKPRKCRKGQRKRGKRCVAKRNGKKVKKKQKQRRQAGATKRSGRAAR